MANTQFESDFQPAPPKQGRGCLFGCLIAGGLVLGSLLCAGVGGYWFVTGQIAKYTSDTPLELPTVDFTDEQLAELQQRMESFGNVMEASADGQTPVGQTSDTQTPDAQAPLAGAAPTELVITAEEINAMICKEKEMRGKIFVKIDNGQVSGDVSFPLDEIPGGKGRYFNGSAGFNVSMENGRLFVTLAGAEVNGEAVPQEILDSMAGENLAKDMYKDPKQRKMLERFESIEVGDGQVTLKLKPVDPKADDGEKANDTQKAVDKVNTAAELEAVSS